MSHDPSLHRTNINLYATDCDWLRRRYGWGWTERVRDMVHHMILAAKANAEWEPTNEELFPETLDDPNGPNPDQGT